MIYYDCRIILLYRPTGGSMIMTPVQRFIARDRFVPEDLNLPFDASPYSPRDRRWEYPGEQVVMLETTRHLLVNETKDLAAFTALMDENDRARTIDQLVLIIDYTQGLIAEINQHNRKE